MYKKVILEIWKVPIDTYIKKNANIFRGNPVDFKARYLGHVHIYDVIQDLAHEINSSSTNAFCLQPSTTDI